MPSGQKLGSARSRSCPLLVFRPPHGSGKLLSRPWSQCQAPALYVQPKEATKMRCPFFGSASHWKEYSKTKAVISGGFACRRVPECGCFSVPESACVHRRSMDRWCSCSIAGRHHPTSMSPAFHGSCRAEVPATPNGGSLVFVVSGPVPEAPRPGEKTLPCQFLVDMICIHVEARTGFASSQGQLLQMIEFSQDKVVLDSKRGHVRSRQSSLQVSGDTKEARLACSYMATAYAGTDPVGNHCFVDPAGFCSRCCRSRGPCWVKCIAR